MRSVLARSSVLRLSPLVAWTAVMSCGAAAAPRGPDGLVGRLADGDVPSGGESVPATGPDSAVVHPDAVVHADAVAADARPSQEPAPDDVADATADRNGPVVADASATSDAGEGSGAGGDVTCPALTAGWTAYQPMRVIHFEGAGANPALVGRPATGTQTDTYCNYTNTNGVELFKMTKNPAGVRQRCEARVQNGYSSGIQQFEGDVRVTSGDGTCVLQIFKFLMLVAYPQNGGELHQHSQAFLASGVFGKWVHVNTVHDVAAGKVDIYLDCVKKLTIPQAAPSAADGWYNKYGVYNLGGQLAQSEWKNVKYYRK
jgi:hypothetical protein